MPSGSTESGARERARRDAREDDQHERDGDRSNTSRFHRVLRSTRDYDARGGRRPSTAFATVGRDDVEFFFKLELDRAREGKTCKILTR